FYDELLAQPPREPRSDETRENVGQSAGGRGGDDAHRPRRIVLRPSDTRHRRERGSTRGQMQKISAGEVYFLTSLSDINPSPHRRWRMKESLTTPQNVG